MDKNILCKHCFELEASHASYGKWCPRLSEYGHFAYWDKGQTFEAVDIKDSLERLEITTRQRDNLYEELKQLMDWRVQFLKEFDKQSEDFQKLKKAMRSIILCLAAHPDNDEGSEFADMISIGHEALNDK